MSPEPIAAQSRKASVSETLTNTAVGYVINQTAQLILFPLVGVHVPLTTNIALGAMFTVISVIRGYALRRFFQCRQRKLLQRIVT